MVLKPGVVQEFSRPETGAPEFTQREWVERAWVEREWLDRECDGEDAKAVLGRTTSPAITTIEALTSVIVARLRFMSLLLVGTAWSEATGHGRPGRGVYEKQ